jgi:hypothetical protein
MSKRRRNKSHRKERVTEIRVAFDRDVVIGGLSAPGEEPMQFFGVDGKPLIPSYIEIGQGYPRKKPGLKTVHRGPADPLAMHRDPTRSLMRFPTILAVDTNTRAIGGTTVSVTAFAVVRDLRFDQQEPLRWHAAIVDQDAFEFHGATIAPELLGWKKVLECAVATPAPTPAALIVDSELGRLQRYNRREEDIVDGFPLPEGFELIYASGERGTAEFVGNAALAHCDRIATSILDRIERDPSAQQTWPNTLGNPWVTRERTWTKKPPQDG